MSFVDDSNLQYINLNAKMFEFINYDTKELNIQSISIILPSNALAYIRAITIPYSPIEYCEVSLKMGNSLFKSTTWAMRKLLVHHIHKIFNWIWKLNLLSK